MASLFAFQFSTEDDPTYALNYIQGIYSHIRYLLRYGHSLRNHALLQTSRDRESTHPIRMTLPSYNYPSSNYIKMRY